MRPALILIDMQNDYFPGGKMELEGPVEAAMQARLLIDLFRGCSWPTVHIQHISTRPGSTFFLPDTEGVKFFERISPLEGEKIIEKHYPNSFRETGLLEYLGSLSPERLVVCGMMTHMCVDATVRAAADFGYSVLLAADACATRSLTYADTVIPADHVHKSFLSALKSYAQVITTDELITQLTS